MFKQIDVTVYEAVHMIDWSQMCPVIHLHNDTWTDMIIYIGFGPKWMILVKKNNIYSIYIWQWRSKPPLPNAEQQHFLSQNRSQHPALTIKVKSSNSPRFRINSPGRASITALYLNVKLILLSSCFSSKQATRPTLHSCQDLEGVFDKTVCGVSLPVYRSRSAVSQTAPTSQQTEVN